MAKPLNSERIVLTMTEELSRALGHALHEGETRLNFIRNAIQREINFRQVDTSTNPIPEKFLNGLNPAEQADLTQFIQSKIFKDNDFWSRNIILTHDNTRVVVETRAKPNQPITE